MSKTQDCGKSVVLKPLPTCLAPDQAACPAGCPCPQLFLHPAARGPGPTGTRERAPVGGRGAAAGSAEICILPGPRAGQAHPGGLCRGPQGEHGWEAAGLQLLLRAGPPEAARPPAGAQVPPRYGRAQFFGNNLSLSSPRSPAWPRAPGDWQTRAVRGSGVCVRCGAGLWVPTLRLLLPGGPEPGWEEDSSINTDSKPQTFVLDTGL